MASPSNGDQGPGGCGDFVDMREPVPLSRFAGHGRISHCVAGIRYPVAAYELGPQKPRQCRRRAERAVGRLHLVNGPNTHSLGAVVISFGGPACWGRQSSAGAPEGQGNGHGYISSPRLVRNEVLVRVGDGITLAWQSFWSRWRTGRDSSSKVDELPLSFWGSGRAFPFIHSPAAASCVDHFWEASRGSPWNTAFMFSKPDKISTQDEGPVLLQRVAMNYMVPWFCANLAVNAVSVPCQHPFSLSLFGRTPPLFAQHSGLLASVCAYNR